jgi:hypothetical protein
MVKPPRSTNSSTLCLIEAGYKPRTLDHAIGTLLAASAARF